MITNNGLRLGNTRAANWVADRICEIAKMLGRMYGRRWVSFIYAYFRSRDAVN